MQKDVPLSPLQQAPLGKYSRGFFGLRVDNDLQAIAHCKDVIHQRGVIRRCFRFFGDRPPFRPEFDTAALPACALFARKAPLIGSPVHQVRREFARFQEEGPRALEGIFQVTRKPRSVAS